MSKDYRIDFIRKVEEILLGYLPGETTSEVMARITTELDKYELAERQTDIVPYSGKNERTLQRYCACLFIDGKSEKTIAQYKRTVMKMSQFLQKLYTDIGPYDIRLFLAYEKNRGASNRTLENTRANLSAFFQWMFVEELIEKNPCITIKPIRFTDKIRYPFSAVELDAIRAACKTTKERALVEMLASSGVRVAELATMTIHDIDFGNLSVHVRNGKGAKERTTYLNEVAAVHLHKYLEERNENGDALLYNCRHEPMNPGGIRYVLKVIAKRAGVDNVHPHRFRRTFATGLAARGMPIQEVQKILGHSNINTTLEYVCSSDKQVKMSYSKYAA